MTENIQLDKNGQGEVAFTVTNATTQSVRTQIRIKPRDEAQSAWFSVKGNTEWDLAPNATQEVTVQAIVPVGTSAGQYRFSIVAVDTNNPDEHFSESQAVSLEVKDTSAPKPIKDTPAPKPAKDTSAPKAFPWWIPVVIVVALVVVGVVVWLVWPSSETVKVPHVVEQSQEEATQALEAVGLTAGLPEGVEGPLGTVVEQDPAAGQEVEDQSQI